MVPLSSGGEIKHVEIVDGKIDEVVKFASPLLGEFESVEVNDEYIGEFP